jgi:hypothetical protein
MFERTRSFLQRLTAGRREPTEGERRAWDRYPSGRETTVRANVDGRAPLTAGVRDVSRGGMRLIVDQPVEEGDMIRIELPPLNGEPVTAVMACVVHVCPEPPAEWSLGCNFATELNDDDLRSLGAKRVRTEDTDQRSWERVAAHGRAVVRPAGSFAADPQTVPIHNISPTGVAVRLDRRVEPGTLLQLDLQSEAGAPVLTILGCVVYMSDVGDGRWLAGCNFIRELDDLELQKLT